MGYSKLHHKKTAFIKAYSACANVTRSAEIADIHRVTHYTWLREDSEYATAFTEAKEIAADVLEDEAVRRGHDGVPKPVYQGGKLVGHVQEYSDTLLIFLLKGAKPEKYRDTWKGEISGPNGGPIETADLTKLSDAEISTLSEFARKVAGPEDDKG